MPEAEIGSIAGNGPNAARAILALYRAWRVAREDAGGIALPSGRRILLPNEEARDLFDEYGNYFPRWKPQPRRSPPRSPQRPRNQPRDRRRLRHAHGLTVSVQPLEGAHRRFDPQARTLPCRRAFRAKAGVFRWRSSSRFLEARDAVEAVVQGAAPTSPEAAALMRVGLLNYVAGALLIPTKRSHAVARDLRHDVEAIAARFGVSFEQACHRLSSLQRPGARGVPFFFLRVDPPGTSRSAFRPRASRSRVRRLLPAMGGAYRARNTRTGAGAGRRAAGRGRLPLLRAGQHRPGRAMGRAAAVHIVAMGCNLAHAGELVYADGLDLEHATRRHRPVLPLVRPPRLPQPRLPAAGTPSRARSLTTASSPYKPEVRKS